MNITFIHYPTPLLQRKDLQASDKLVYGYLKFRQGKNDCTWPRQQTMAEALGLSADTVSRSCRRLAGKGLLVLKTVFDGEMRHNLYQVKELTAGQTEESPDPAECGIKNTIRENGGQEGQNAPGDPAECGDRPRSMQGNTPQHAVSLPADCGMKRTTKNTMKNNKNELQPKTIFPDRLAGQAEMVLEIHLQHCEFAYQRAEKNPLFKRRLYNKIRSVIPKYGFPKILEIIQKNSRQAKSASPQDDGFGLILHILRQNALDRTGQMLRNRWTCKELEEQEFQDRRQALIARVRGQKTRHVQGV